MIWARKGYYKLLVGVWLLKPLRDGLPESGFLFVKGINSPFWVSV